MGIIMEAQVIQKLVNFQGWGINTQIWHFLASLVRRANVFCALTPFKKLLEADVFKRALSNIYFILVVQMQMWDWCQRAWEKDVVNESKEEQWCKVSLLCQKMSNDVALKEHCYKLRHRWYWTLVKFLKCFLRPLHCVGDLLKKGQPLGMYGGTVRSYQPFGNL